ncbi:hypothetical protein [Actinomadura sp. SCN-SB]|uniref:hypothetical protein n=1 Tax=Actinomadura sp. SCN-SB TaxID=3373092 RepID=UPI003753DA2A
MNSSTISHATSRVADRTSSSRHPFDMAEKTFALLTQGPSPLAVDGAALGHGLPARVIPLDELRDVLLHPSTSQAPRDAVWSLLVNRARQRSSAWIVGCVGVALPGLRTALRRDLRRCVAWEEQPGTDRVAGELLTAFYDALLDIDINRPGIAARLLWRSTKKVQRAYAPRVRVVPVEPQVLAELVPNREAADSHVDLLMDAAVQQGVITRDEAELITATRLEKISPHTIAEQLGISYEALMKRRRRAEKRLVEAMRDGGLRGGVEDLMSSPGA